MIYTDGTIAIKAGSPIVTGTGTQWKKNIHGIAAGQLINIEYGITPISMMIRAVNSDTELVLSFNAPVTLNGAKYSVATTTLNTGSDAARVLTANQGYIVYFLQAMQQWMTDTGQVEIEMPNGQKVTLDSVKAMNEAIANAKPGDASVTKKGIVQLSSSVGTSTTKVPHEKAVNDALAKKADSDKLGTAAGKNTGTASGNVMEVGAFGLGDSVNIGGGASGVNTFVSYKTITDAQSDGFPNNGAGLQAVYDPIRRAQFYITITGLLVYRFSMMNGPDKATWTTVWGGNNTSVDGNGFIKRSSPIIQIHTNGNFETNDESEGAHVHHTNTGQYHITGILGYNSDGAWGVNGGISVPKDNNGLELVYVADRVLEDGGIIIETCHRQHTHLPEKFQNWRLKE
ncbi:MAG TPA: hypothetical protein DIT05_04500, partial [Morganella sp. (in: Bacteria)]|nr:hypothetical protein [Morganella sp. (in: enterobacteria)]